MLFFKGRVDGVKRREYQGRQRMHLQFVTNSEDGELSFMEIRVPDNMESSRFGVGAQAEFPVQYSIVNGEIYFKISEKAAPSDIKVTSAK